MNNTPNLHDNTQFLFVYGTLMIGRHFHARYLSPLAPIIDNAVLDGYRMFDIGAYPGIVPGKGKVKGEVYRVDARRLAEIDRLEGEGNLYVRTSVNIATESDCSITAYAYVYNRRVTGCQEIPFNAQPYEKEKFAWYVSYGSNLLEERLKYYILGGECKFNGKTYAPCSDTTLPLKSVPVSIPYSMYYSNYSRGSWENSAVCFLDTSKPGKAYGRAYLINRRQLGEIHAKEGTGVNWYPKRVPLENIGDYEAFTFTNPMPKEHENICRISFAYGFVLYKGMKETYPDMSDDEIYRYLMHCGQ